MWDFFVFSVIGLLAGAAARLCYRENRPIRVMGTMVLGLVGALIGGLISRPIWPTTDGELFSGALLTSLGGAVFLLILGPWIAYARRDPLARPPGS
jgi:uncharacterized membrane protein YeaQ/YmgE (transglycosylase-associated protein family)